MHRSEAKERTSASLRELSDPMTPEAATTSDSSDSLMNELKTSRRQSKYDPEDQIGGEDSSDNAVKGPGRARRVLKRMDSSPVTQSEDTEHGYENSRDLNNSQGNGKHAGLTRVKRPTTELSTRQKRLELLRRRHAGKNQQSPSDNELEIEGGGPSPQANLITLGDPDEDSDQDPPLRGGEAQNLDEYEEDFVVDDSDTLGVPAALDEIPLQFTRHSHKKPIEHFKDVVEWMVHNKLNPAFPRSDPVYKIARQKLDDVVQGFAGSKFISSVWKADFSAALKKYPDVARIDVPTMFDQKCQACGRSGHPAKHQLIFSGKPYHRESLEDISSDEDSEDDSNEGEREPVPQSEAFFLGRTCNANAETAHALYHWRHQLNQFVLDLLRAEGHTSAEKIIERENWSVKKREKYANKVVDEMEEDGRMKQLYREFKENIEAARSVKNEAYSYGR
ncbi:MAG: hypothetical protein Q9207_007275 [Kuettlingeria erythrocarpa]